MSMSFCSGRPHSVRVPEQLPRERLRHRDSLLHKQTHKHTKSALSHTLNRSASFSCPAQGPKSSARGHYTHSPSHPRLIQIPLVIFLNNTA